MPAPPQFKMGMQVPSFSLPAATTASCAHADSITHAFNSEIANMENSKGDVMETAELLKIEKNNRVPW